MSLFEDASLIVTPNAVKAGKLYAIKPDSGAGDLTVTRATEATRVNSAGLIEVVANNVPRLDYTNGSCPSILVEPQRTNLALQSEQFDNASWIFTGLQGSITSNTTISPNNTLTADTLVGSGVNGIQGFVQSIQVVSGSNYSLSLFAKKGTNNFIQIIGGLVSFGTEVFANFDLQNGTIGNKGTLTNANIENYGNGWFRCVVSAVAIANNTQGTFAICMPTSSASIRAEQNSLTNNVNLWGAQLEVGSNATSYIPTVATAVTRNADVISKTGISDLIGQTEGTLFVDFVPSRTSDILNISASGTFQSDIGIGYDLGNRRFFVNFFISPSYILQYTSPTNSLPANTITKIAVAYKSGDISVFFNGTQITSSSSSFTIINQFSRLRLNQNNFTGSDLVNYRQIGVFKTRLNNMQLAQLTTL